MALSTISGATSANAAIVRNRAERDSLRLNQSNMQVNIEMRQGHDPSNRDQEGAKHQAI